MDTWTNRDDLKLSGVDWGMPQAVESLPSKHKALKKTKKHQQKDWITYICTTLKIYLKSLNYTFEMC
jgi:hypothetical protein